ncbi:DUF2752 domain-containing protein [Nonomuraea africana]|uniref:DUF2752 domain-containing protein n=1 Tax=Nonomuraea africana TaxID=46171 RepID=UPI0033ECA0BF
MVTHRLRAVLAPLGVALAAGAAVAYVGVVDPNEAGHYPVCPLFALTGLLCPGCGALRATHALAHLDVVAALGLNPLLVLATPVVAYVWARWLIGAWSGSAWRPSPPRPVYLWSLLALILLFGVARNLPFGAFLAP